jgi:hypothetical protein
MKHKDLNNSIINFNSKFDYNSEILLLIYAYFDNDTMKSDFNKLNMTSNRTRIF